MPNQTSGYVYVGRLVGEPICSEDSLTFAVKKMAAALRVDMDALYTVQYRNVWAVYRTANGGIGRLVGYIGEEAK